MAASHIADHRACGQLGYYPIERGQPILDKIMEVAWAEKPCSRTKQARAVVTPGHTPAPLESLLHPWLRVRPCHHAIESSHHRHGTILDREHHRLLRRQGELLGGGVIGKVMRSRLLREPLPQIPGMNP